MDLGRFYRSRWTLGLWFGVPVLLAALALTPASLYLRRLNQDVAERRRIVEDLPAAEKRLQNMERLLARVTPGSDQLAAATEEATRRLDAAAQAAGITLRSVKVGESDEQTDAAFRTFSIVVQMTGSLQGMVQWLDGIQRPGLLLEVRMVSLTAASLPPDPQFSGEVRILVRLRKAG